MRYASWVLLLLLVATTSWAAPKCDISTPGLNFGSYDPLSASPTDAVGSIEVACGQGIPYSIEFEVSQQDATGGREMKITGGPTRATYYLYTDSARTRIWGDGTSGTHTVNGIGDGTTHQVTVYGRVPAGQNLPFGTYRDSVLARVAF